MREAHYYMCENLRDNDDINGSFSASALDMWLLSDFFFRRIFI